MKPYDAFLRFFHGDPVGENMYSMSIGDTWLYFYDNHLCAILKLVPAKALEDRGYVLDELDAKAKEALSEELPLDPDSTEILTKYELAAKALQLASAEISALIASRVMSKDVTVD